MSGPAGPVLPDPPGAALPTPVGPAPVGAAVRGELGAALVAAAVLAVLRSLAPRSLLRTAASGREVTLAAGPATASGLLAATAANRCSPAVVAVLAATAAGVLDDLVEPRQPTGGTGPPRGLTGHLRALRSGRVTTGAAKTVVIGAGSLVAALMLARSRPDRRGPVAGRVLADTATIAGTANLVNLFDLRPGRAGKVAVLGTAVLIAGGAGPAPGVLGTVAATLDGDLRGRWMLGDTGANALGAALGLRAAAADRRSLRSGWLVVVLGLTLASERVSFTDVIAGHRLLRVVDDLGRR